MLGVVDRAERVVTRRPLHAGQSLLLYTDGLIEGRSRPRSSARLDDEGLHELVRTPAGRSASPAAHHRRDQPAPRADLPDDTLLVLVVPAVDGEEPLGRDVAVPAAGAEPLA